MTVPALTHQDVCAHEAAHAVLGYSVGMLVARPGFALDTFVRRMPKRSSFQRHQSGPVAPMLKLSSKLSMRTS